MLTDVSALSAGSWNSEVGEFVSDEHVRMSEMLSTYDPGRYALLYVPARSRETQEQRRTPWAIQETNSQTHEKYIIRYMSDADMKHPAKVMAWLAAGDLLRNSPDAIMDRIELEEAAERELKRLGDRDARLAKLDMAAFLAKGGRDKKERVQLGRDHYFDRKTDGH